MAVDVPDPGCGEGLTTEVRCQTGNFDAWSPARPATSVAGRRRDWLGYAVRALARNPGKPADASWRDRAEVVPGDLAEPD